MTLITDRLYQIIQGLKSRITIALKKYQAGGGKTRREVFSELHSFSRSLTFDLKWDRITNLQRTPFIGITFEVRRKISSLV